MQVFKGRKRVCMYVCWGSGEFRRGAPAPEQRAEGHPDALLQPDCVGLYASSTFNHRVMLSKPLNLSVSLFPNS